MRSTRRMVLLKLAASTVPLAAGLSSLMKKASDYIVQPGDTVSGISKRTGIPQQNIQKWNNLRDINRIRQGQRLVMTAPSRRPAMSHPVPPRSVAPVQRTPTVAPVQAPSVPPSQRAAFPLKNNNPGNMRSYKVGWYGEKGGTPVGQFASFDTPQNGLRAAGRNLYTLAGRLKNPTLRTLIPLYAPPVENDTNGYVNDVSKFSGIGADKALNLKDHKQLATLLPHIIRRESGKKVSDWYTQDEYAEAARRAMISI